MAVWNEKVLQLRPSSWPNKKHHHITAPPVVHANHLCNCSNRCRSCQLKTTVTVVEKYMQRSRVPTYWLNLGPFKTSHLISARPSILTWRYIIWRLFHGHFPFAKKFKASNLYLTRLVLKILPTSTTTTTIFGWHTFAHHQGQGWIRFYEILASKLGLL